MADVELATAEVAILNVAVVEPTGTVTVEGTVALGLFDERFMTVAEL